MKSKAKSETVTGFHFYGSSACEWVCKDSREKVLRYLASVHGDRLSAANVKKHGGLEVVVTRVELPEAATYTIKNYVPHAITERDSEGNLVRTGKRVPLRQYERLLIMDKKGTAVLNPDLPQVTDEELAADDDKPITKQEYVWG